MEFSIKKCGCLTEWLHMMDVGQEITIRGPYGKPFPVETDLKGKDLLFIAGGIGLAPVSYTHLYTPINHDEIETYIRKSGGRIIQRKGATFYAIALSTCHICKCIISGMAVSYTHLKSRAWLSLSTLSLPS